MKIPKLKHSIIGNKLLWVDFFIVIDRNVRLEGRIKYLVSVRGFHS